MEAIAALRLVKVVDIRTIITTSTSHYERPQSDASSQHRRRPIKNRKTQGRDGYAALEFLDHHKLAHSPDHFSFAYAYLQGEDVVFRAKVDSEIDGGLRLTADKLKELSQPGVPTSLLPQIDHLAMRVLDVVGDAMMITKDLNNELIEASTNLLRDAETNVDKNAGLVIVEMVQRAQEAEAQFAEAAHRARAIRAELTALQTLGRHDPLTGLLTRDALIEYIGESSSKDRCIALLDVDGLRRVNESHSPAVGDRLLKTVARSLTEDLAAQKIARWRCGTFAVLIEATDLSSAKQLVDRACESIASRELKVRETDAPLGPISISAGVVTIANNDPATLFLSVNADLREAKQRRKDALSRDLCPQLAKAS